MYNTKSSDKKYRRHKLFTRKDSQEVHMKSRGQKTKASIPTSTVHDLEAVSYDTVYTTVNKNLDEHILSPLRSWKL